MPNLLATFFIVGLLRADNGCILRLERLRIYNDPIVTVVFFPV